MLEPKLRKAAQAILRNNSLLITSGSGMAADCPLFENDKVINRSYEKDYIPTFRGTYGLWREYPVLRRKLISFDELVEENFFKDSP